MTQTQGHNFKMVSLLVIAFLISGLAAIHTLVSAHAAFIIDQISFFLLYIEHALNGNTDDVKVSTTSSPTGTE